MQPVFVDFRLRLLVLDGRRRLRSVHRQPLDIEYNILNTERYRNWNRGQLFKATSIGWPALLRRQKRFLCFLFVVLWVVPVLVAVANRVPAKVISGSVLSWISDLSAIAFLVGVIFIPMGYFTSLAVGRARRRLAQGTCPSCLYGLYRAHETNPDLYPCSNCKAVWHTRQGVGICIDCGYDLSPMTIERGWSVTCPECGSEQIKPRLPTRKI